MANRQVAMQELRALDNNARCAVRGWLAAEQELANTQLLECDDQPHVLARLHGEARVLRKLRTVFEQALIER